MRSWFKYVPGRQNSGYFKLPLFVGRWFDAYILKYPTGSFIKPHTDPLTPSLRHYRLNIVIWKARNGGEFVCDDTIFSTDRIKLFRPDLKVHSVKKVREGTRYVLSIGWALKEKHAS